MKVLFLDIDGVLTSDKHDLHLYHTMGDVARGIDRIDPEALENLRYLGTLVSDLSIIITSELRLDTPMRRLQQLFRSAGIYIPISGYNSLFNRYRK